ncbi:MAG TPA: signal peptidase II [Actinomycetota bacterium]|nr:signal peptidase II [Actinomycetota bacterium]
MVNSRGGSFVYGSLALICAVVVTVDQITKQWALEALADAPIHLVDGILSLRLAFNSGGAFGILQGMPGFFLVATLAVMVAILLWVRRLEDHRWIVPLGLVLGGGLGNVADRIFRDTGGRVVDFIDLHVWPVFNVADAAISSGVVILIVLSFRSPPDEAADGAGDEEPAVARARNERG